MTPEQRKLEEEQIKNVFSELQKKLKDLKNEVKSETDDSKKQEKNNEIQKLEKELSEMKTLIDMLSSLQEADLQSLKTRLESTKKVYQEYRGEVVDLQNEKFPTPTTYELLKDSPTIKGFEGDSNYPGLLKIIESNPKKFEKVPGSTPEAKLEYIFTTIRRNIVLFLKNKLGNSDKYNKVINNTIAPALEWNMMEMLRNQGNTTNVSMLEGMNKISWNSFNQLVKGVYGFATNTKGSFDKFNQWVNAIDYLSVHNGILNSPEKSAVLTSPVEFKKYLNDPIFAPKDTSGNMVTFSPYKTVGSNIFKVDENKTFEFGISLKEKQDILNHIGNIRVVNNPNSTALIVKMANKSEKFLGATSGLQKAANSLLDGVNAVNSVTKMFGIDILSEFNKAPEQRSFIYKIIDFVCKLIGITGGLEGIVKRWRLDRLNLTDEKNENISLIFNKYHELVGKGTDISITDENSCKSVLADFDLTDLDKQSTTKGDHLRDVISDNVNLKLISPSVVQQILGDSYLKREIIIVNGKRQEKISVDYSKITEDQKRELVHKHIVTMKTHLESNYVGLMDFYKDIHNTDDLVLCMTASLYADREDVIEGMKAKVFLPENYGVVYQSSSSEGGNGTNGSHGRGNGGGGNGSGGRENLDSQESSDKQKVSEQWIYDKAVEYGITDKRQIAYVLSTVQGECAFKNQKEVGGENRDYGKIDPSTGKAYYGRGFIQLTHKYNYEKYTQIIRNSGRNFEDNNGNTLRGSQIDLVNNPDIILQSNDLAAFVIMDWMKNGGPDRVETKKLSYYINETKTDYYHARIIVNGMSSKPQRYADNALAYQNKLGDGSIDSPMERNDLLIGPHLLAQNKNEIGGLGNSIMNGFQGLNAKTEFPNMDGIEGKSTVTHPHRFNSQNDVLAYKNTHSSIKSFMFYFGANTRDNDRTLSDIKKRSEWLQAEGIQPVLCTCVGEDKQTWLKELNQNLISLGREKNRPVLDFAKSYRKGDIALSSDGVHPTSYSPMTNIINGQLSQA